MSLANDSFAPHTARAPTPQRLPKPRLQWGAAFKALRKLPEERYASVGDLAADIGNHLQGRPVGARSGGWRYRSSRFLRRHAVAAVLALIAATALLGGLAAALWQANEARLQRDVARSESDKS